MATATALWAGTNWDLHRTFLAVSYGLVATGFLPIALSGELGWLAPSAFVAAMLTSLLRDPRGSVPRPQTARIWTTVVLAAFVAAIVWSTQDSNWLLHAMEFALLITVSRFFQRRFAKDHLQLFGLSFILLLVGAIVQPGPLFAVCFLAYTVMTMWGLTLLHLVREIEIQTHTGPEHLLPVVVAKRRWLGLRKAKPQPEPVVWPEMPVHASTIQWRSRRLIGPRYFAATSVLSLLVLAGSALFFFLFPRLGMGFFFAQTRPGKNVTGFSTDAELGQFGALKNNAEVVARVTIPTDPARLQQPLRLRGVAFDRFGTTGWTRLKEEPWPLRYVNGRLTVPRIDPPEPGVSRSWRAEIYLEPLDPKNRVLFAPPQTWAVELLDVRFDAWRGRRKQVLRTQSGDLTYVAPPESALHYAVDIVEPISLAADAGLLRNARGQPPTQLLTRYTDLPPTLDPRIAVLAKQLAGSATNWYDQAANVEAGLRAGWTYSLAGDQDADKPLEDFLFGKKRGHCEYFATSMALMLRTLGIPARPVHGFAGGQFNPIGNYKMIRQGDAHSWVEVFFPRIGWRTFDPTPASGQETPAENGLLQQLRQVADSASLLWYQWVVEYDLDRQVEMLRSLGGLLKDMQGSHTLRKLLGDGGGGSADTADNKPRSTKIPAWAIAVLVGLALAAAIRLVWQWRRDRTLRHFDPVIGQAVDKLQAALHRHGWERQPHETWHSVAKRVQPVATQAGLAIGEFAEQYDQARYAPSLAEPLRQAVVAALTQARAAVRAVAVPRKKVPHAPLAGLLLVFLLPAVSFAEPPLPTVAGAIILLQPQAEPPAPVQRWDGDLGSLLANGLLGAYRLTLSATDMDLCAFEPSCSHFAGQAVARRGWMLGLLLGADRLLRDHPAVPQLGYLPVGDNRHYRDPVDRYLCPACTRP